MSIAVTGGIAEGKSTVLAYLAEFGYSTLSSDAIARDCFESAEAQHQLAELLGVSLPVERDALRDRIANAPDVRRSVNRLMHPFVLARIRSQKADFVEVPLLIETCMQGEFDQVWVVTCGPEEQRRRLFLRSPQASSLSLLSLQLSTCVKSPFADVVVRTNNERETVKWFVRNAARSAFNLDCAL